MIEFCIGIVAMLAVIGGIFQLGRMGRGRMDARVEATRIATARSMLGEDITGLYIPNYVREMYEGADGRTYSVDDRAIGGNTEDVYNRIVLPMNPGGVRQHVPGSPIADMEDSMEMMMGMGLVAGTGMDLNIPVLPVVRRLFFNRNTVDIQVQVWMTRTGDIY
ncbi:MAG: hypothetical protein JJU29_06245 [Verrucomicrobia bacterium]|nr:hypothetical protein [Verrucomicrobiota bacterium]MCH8511468.1 hypothetical protein [Kiritimatiellia bacterium]